MGAEQASERRAQNAESTDQQPAERYTLDEALRLARADRDAAEWRQQEAEEEQAQEEQDPIIDPRD